MLNDDDAMRVNDVLIELRDNDVDAYNAVFLHYYSRAEGFLRYALKGEIAWL